MNILYSSMLAERNPEQVPGLARFFKTGPGEYGEGDRFLGIKVPVTRKVVAACWRYVDFPELEECISSEFHEMRLAALRYYAPHHAALRGGTPRRDGPAQSYDCEVVCRPSGASGVSGSGAVAVTGTLAADSGAPACAAAAGSAEERESAAD